MMPFTAWQIAPYDPALALAAIALWNRALGGAFPMTARLWRQNVEDDPHWRPGDGLIVWGADGALAGFVLTRRFHGHDDPANADLARLRGLGWIVALVVVPEARGQGLGSRLLALAEERLRTAGAERCDLGGSLGHFLPGPPAGDERAPRFWQRHGYQPTRQVYDLSRSLAGWTPGPPPPALASGDYQIAPGRPGQEGAILDFLARAFPGRWRYFVADTFARGGAPEDVMVLTDRAGSVEGFLCSWQPGSALLGPGAYWCPATGGGERRGGIGPLGIGRPARGLGLGLALMEAGLATLQARGVEECVVDWTELVDFYGRLGFTIWRRYWRCAPKLLAP